MEECWAQNPEVRPDFETIGLKLKELAEGA